MTRNGKIARLPLAIREELNQRLQNGEQSKQLVEWLNSLPKVQSAMKAHFEGRPISESNLSEWKTGGYLSWEADHQTLEAVTSLVEGANDLQKAAKDGLTDRLGLFLAAKMAVELREVDSVPDAAEKAKVWRELRGSLVALQRGEINSERLRLERQKYAERLRKDQAEERRRRESQKPEMTPEEKEARINEIMGTD
jgi:Protein of unknown function (DUF3486)